MNDSPCRNCSFQSECEITRTLEILFCDDRLPQEEGFIGMLYEIDDYRKRRVSGDIMPRFFIEQAVSEAHANDKILARYENLYQAHEIVKRWMDASEAQSTYTGSRYRRRLGSIMDLPPDLVKSLYIEECNDESTFEWCLDNIANYIVLTNDTPPCDIAADLEDLDFQADQDEENVTVTPEQRAIQWAINNGGAQNL